MSTPTSALFSSCSSTRTPPDAVRRGLRCPERLVLPAWNEPSNARCHSRRPPPARRRQSQQSTFINQQHEHSKQRPSRHGSMTRPLTSFSRSISIAVLFCLFFLCRSTNAGEVYGATEIFPGELLFDRRPPPPLPRMHLNDKREDDSSSSSSASSASLPEVTTVTITPTSGSPSTTESTIQTASETAAASLPKPFDTSLGNNFTTTSCPAFFQKFLNDQAFNDCLPFSLLLQTSNAFFAAQRSFLQLTRILNATCAVNLPTCSTLISNLAQQIPQTSACGADFQLQNPMVLQAYNGFLAYQTLYHAGCLTDPEGNYCFANAVTNTSATASSYIYYLPLGVQLPGGSRPACTQCLQDTMAIFAQTAGNSTQPLSKDYGDAAEQIQMNCGPTFVGTSAQRSAAGRRTTSSSTAMLGLAILLSSLLVQLLP